MGDLKVEPEFFRGAEKAGQAERRVGGDGIPPVDNVVDPGRRHLDFMGQRPVGDAKGLEELLLQDFARMDALGTGLVALGQDGDQALGPAGTILFQQRQFPGLVGNDDLGFRRAAGFLPRLDAALQVYHPGAA
jgi:hypothetical protein